MPESSPPTLSMSGAHRDTKYWQRRAWAYAMAAVLGYALLTLPILTRHKFDPSIFIHGGDRFIDATQLVSPIIVHPNSDGYDGQFFYRMALSPFQLNPSAFGIRLDAPAYRTQRIFYPLLVWVTTFGHAAFVPVAMYLVNLVGLAAVAWFGTRLTARLELPAWIPLVIMLWPGFVVALTHDTAEIVAAAFLLGAVYSYFAKRLFAYAVLGALSTLTRQTTLPVLFGLACFEVIQAIRPDRTDSRWHRTLICALPLAAFPLWLAILHWVLGYPAQERTNLLGWPFLGVAAVLRDTLIGAKHFVQPDRPTLDAVVRAYVVGSICWLLGFCAVVVARVPAVLRMGGTGALATGWLPALALMSLMTARGGWVDQTGYFRAFTECYVVGCLVLAVRPVPRWVAWIMLAGAALALLGAWVLAIGER